MNAIIGWVFYSLRFTALSLAGVGLSIVASSRAGPYQKTAPVGDDLGEWVVFCGLGPSQQLAALRQLPREKQLRWIPFIRDYDPVRPYNTQSGLFGALGGQVERLLALNDEETAGWMTEGFNNIEAPRYNDLRPFAQWHTPEGIAFLARKSLSEEPRQVRIVGGAAEEPVSFTAASVLLNHLLPNFVSLPWPVREWARDSERARANAYAMIADGGAETQASDDAAEEFVAYRLREIAQLWWRANERAIVAGKWEEVRPGEGFDTPRFRALLAEFAVKEPQQTREKLSPLATSPLQAPISEAEPSRPPPVGNRLAWGIACGLTILGLAATLLKRGRILGKRESGSRE